MVDHVQTQLHVPSTYTEQKPCFKSLIQEQSGLSKSDYFKYLIFHAVRKCTNYLIEYDSSQFIGENIIRSRSHKRPLYYLLLVDSNLPQNRVLAGRV